MKGWLNEEKQNYCCGVGTVSGRRMCRYGKCGDDAEWTYDTETKTLTISGTGDVTKTFYSEKWFSGVKKLIVEDGIEELHGAFPPVKCFSSLMIQNSITIT